MTEGARAINASWHDEIQASDVPRFLYWQLDAILENCISDLESQILCDLENFVLNRQSTTWFSVYLGSFLYLAILERDTWNLQSWKAKSLRWAEDPRVSANPVSLRPSSLCREVTDQALQTMKWPLGVDPSDLIKMNEQQANVISSHVRAINQASFPFYRDQSEVLVASIGTEVGEVADYAASVSHDFNTLSESTIGPTMCRGC